MLDAWEKTHTNKDSKNNAGIIWRLKLEPTPLEGTADVPYQTIEIGG